MKLDYADLLLIKGKKRTMHVWYQDIKLSLEEFKVIPYK